MTVAQPGLDPAPLATALEDLGSSRHALVLAQPHPRLAVADGDPREVLDALAQVPGSHGGGDLGAALDLAAGLMAGQADARGLLLAGGAEDLPADPRWRVLGPAVPDGFRVGPLLAAAGRTGQTVLYRVQGTPGAQFEILAEVGSDRPGAGPGPAAELVRAGRMPDDGLLAGQLAGLPPETPVRVWLGGTGLDGYVDAAVGPPDPARGKVLVRAGDPGPYERAVRAAGHAVVADPDAEFDIAVYVGQLPERLPAAGIVLIDPPEGAGILRRAAPSFDLALPDPTGSLLAAIPPTVLAPGAVRALIAPTAARSHAAAGSGSWLWQARLAERELAVLALDPAVGLSGQAAFPLLVRDLLALVDPLRPRSDPEPARAGVATVLRPHPRAEAISVIDPAGRVVLATDLAGAELLAPDAVDPQEAAPGIVWRPDRPGLHRVRQEAGGATILDSPVWVQAVGPAVAPGAFPAPVEGGGANRVVELWPLLAALAAAALLCEWAWFNRRRGAF